MENILKKQIIELEKLVDLKDRRIAELEKLLANQQPAISIPSVWQIDSKICFHEYPFPWHSITPPACLKCGQSAPMYTVTSTDIKV